MPSIVVIGGGFAGFWSAVAARRVLAGAGEVVLVSRDSVLQIRPRLYEADPQDLGVDLIAPLSTVGAGFIRDEAVDLDAERGAVRLSSGGELLYDRVIVATGSVMRRPPISGAEDAFSIDTLAEAVAFDRHLAIISERKTPVIAVVGAGFTGLELALELRDRIGRRNPVTAETARIVLIDREAEVGHELGEGPRPVILTALMEGSIEVRLGAEVTGLARYRLEFRDGEVLSADAVVLCTGLAASSFTSKVPAPRDHLGRVLVERTLQARGAKSIFMAGDACVADTGAGRLTLQSCQHALQLGRFAGENAARSLLGRPLVPYQQLDYVTCLDLGRSGAVLTYGWDRTIARQGSAAKKVKRDINTVRIYPPGGALEALLQASELPVSHRSSLSA